MGRSQRHLREFQGGDSLGSPGVGLTLTINTPSAGGVSNPVTLECTATNEDGGRADPYVRWSSNVDGALGQGDGFTTVLTAGAHTITATCNGVTDTVAITVS